MMMTKPHALPLERFLCGSRKAQEAPSRAGKRLALYEFCEQLICRWHAQWRINVVLEYIYAHRSSVQQHPHRNNNKVGEGILLFLLGRE